MIGSIVLTLRDRDGVKRQSIQNQLDRTAKSTIDLVDIKSNEGVDI
jgi:NADH-quinone oxidoreductase subunit J